MFVVIRVLFVFIFVNQTLYKYNPSKNKRHVTMNFIADMLPAKETYTFEDINNEFPKVDEELEKCLNDISSELEFSRDEILKQCERGKDHMEATNALGDELRAVEKSLGDIMLEDLKNAEENFNELVQEMNEIAMSISLVQVVCEIHERLEMLKELCENPTDYMEMVELIEVLDMLINTQPTIPIIPFIVSLREMVKQAKVQANALLKSTFFKHCSFSRDKNTFTLKILGKDTKEFYSILRAVYRNQVTRGLITNLPNSIWENLILPLIIHQCDIVEEISDQELILQIIVKKEESYADQDNVYRNISRMIDHLEKYFNCFIEDNLNLLNFIGSLLKSQLSETILIECVSKKIPRDWKDIPKFREELIESLKNLEEKLRLYGFLDSHWDWLDKIEEIYAEKKCKYFSEKAKQLMKEDLHNMIEIGTPYDPCKTFTNTGEMPQCSISTYIPELVKVGKELINEILEGPEENCEVLFATYKGIFFNYGDFVASHHQKLLETIPQQVALFYNNCMYLYKQLQQWDEIFETNDVLKEYYHDDTSKQFYQVEEVGRMFFDSFVREQKEQIVIILKGTNLQNKKTLECLEENTEKLLRQCLRQQELLKTVWSKVLSYPVYNQTIGDILNTMCDYLINSLVVLEDIGAVVAENLKELFKIVLNRGAKLLTDPNEVFLYVPMWHKFNELIFVLGASLIDISDRWADGKGPLALHFTPYELKQLIRALFQNSDRRAAVLSRIHE